MAFSSSLVQEALNRTFLLRHVESACLSDNFTTEEGGRVTAAARRRNGCHADRERQEAD